MGDCVTGIVPFDYYKWQLRYPEFSNVTSELGQEFWDEAGIHLRNDHGSAVQNLTIRAKFLYMLTSHVAKLAVGDKDDDGSSPLIGRVDKVTKGSVNVSATLDPIKGAEYFIQTKYGLTFWQASARYRTAIYSRKRQYGGGLRVLGGI